MKKAFTLLEIIFVIVLIGILSGTAVFYFRANDSELAQARNQLINHIRYTQHLALMDDRFDPDPNNSGWYGERWRIRFYSSDPDYYVIFSDRDEGNKGGDPDGDREVAIDPYTKERLGRNNPSRDSITHLGALYNTSIESINCDYRDDGTDSTKSIPLSIIFDTLGRPYAGSSRYDEDPDGEAVRAYEGLLIGSGCTITLTHNDTSETATITIYPETGFVK